MAIACALAGCQAYESAPLDIMAHRHSVEARALETETVSEFAERMRVDEDQHQDRFELADGVSWAEAEVLALFYNSELRLARLNAGIALADVETAGLWEDPVFGFDGAEILSPSGPFELGLTLSFTIPISGRLQVEKARAGAAYEAALRRIVDEEWGIRMRVRQAWAAWAVEENRLGVLRGVVERLAPIVETSETLEAAGELARVDGRLIRVELIERRAQLAQVELAARRARLELLRLMGLAPDAEIELAGELSMEDLIAPEEDLERIIERNTLLAVRRAEYRTAEESLRLEIRKQYPDITLGAGYGSEDNDDRLLLGVSMPIPSLNANRAGIAEARARRELARTTAETTFEHLAHKLALTRATVTAAQSQLSSFEDHVIPMLDEQSSEVEQLAQLGEVEPFLVLETVTRVYEGKSRLLDLRLEQARASIEIVRLLGPDEPADPAPVSSIALSTLSTERSRTESAEGDAP